MKITILTAPLFLFASYFRSINGQQEACINQMNNIQNIEYQQQTIEYIVLRERASKILDEAMEIRLKVIKSSDSNMIIRYSSEEYTLLSQATFVGNKEEEPVFSLITLEDKKIFFKLINNYIIEKKDEQESCEIEKQMKPYLERAKKDNAKSDPSKRFKLTPWKYVDDWAISKLENAKFEGIFFNEHIFIFSHKIKDNKPLLIATILPYVSFVYSVFFVLE